MDQERLKAQMDFFQTAEAAAEGARLRAEDAERECWRAKAANNAAEATAAHNKARDAMYAAYEAAAAACKLAKPGDPCVARAEASARRAQDFTIRAAEHANRLEAGPLSGRRQTSHPPT